MNQNPNDGPESAPETPNELIQKRGIAKLRKNWRFACAMTDEEILNTNMEEMSRLMKKEADALMAHAQNLMAYAEAINKPFEPPEE